MIAEKKRITKENFQKCLEGQNQFHLDPANDYEELALGILHLMKHHIWQKVSRSLINKWADKGKFKVIKVGSRVRISREDFEAWLEQRNLERSIQ